MSFPKGAYEGNLGNPRILTRMARERKYRKLGANNNEVLKLSSLCTRFQLLCEYYSCLFYNPTVDNLHISYLRVSCHMKLFSPVLNHNDPVISAEELYRRQFA